MGPGSLRLAWLRFAGPFETIEIMLPLNSKCLNLLLRLCSPLVFFMNYWARLMKGAYREAMEHGAMMRRENASNMMRICVATTDDSVTR